MRITKIDAFAVNLPFRLSFKHSLAARKHSVNVIVVCEILDDTGRRVTGYGESVPRDYVTGETVESALKIIREEYIPRLLGKEFATPLDALTYLKSTFMELGLDEKQLGASWCAVELAVFDAVSRVNGLSAASLLSAFDAVSQPSSSQTGGGVARASIAKSVSYGAVAPFGGTAALTAMLLFFKLYGFKTVKIKVGRDLDLDLAKLKLARSIMGDEVIIRVDANCSWTVDETLYFAERMRQYKITSIEQPLDVEDIAGLQRLTRELPETVLVDESLCTLSQARMLIDLRACDAFNIRISKVGGLLVASEMANLARAAGVACHMGAQVGESAILTAAGRAWAAVKGPLDNCEGSFNKLLLKTDLAPEDVTVKPGGTAPLLDGVGFGVRVDARKLRRLEVRESRDDVDAARKSVVGVHVKSS